MTDYQHLLVPVDLRAHSHLVLQRAIRVAAASGNAALTVMHVVEYLPLDPVGDTLSPTPVEITEDLAAQARERVRDLCANEGLDDAKQLVRIGATQDEIIDVAREVSADLIVIGNHERHGLGVLFSRTEDRVLHHAPCDILAVHLPRS